MSSLSSLVVGDSAITVSCAEILRLRGFPLCGVITADGRVAGWAAKHGVPVSFLPATIPLGAEPVLDLVRGAPIDLLWSIHNLRRLLPDVLALARRFAINYHDAPLPRYAGLHATSWAIAAGESSHGVTWHRVEPEIDTGDVLFERAIEIGPHETAWTLNNRCSEAAVESFGALLDALIQGGLAPRRQDLARRTLFPGWRTPSAGCVIPWDRSAAEVSAFVRGLDFGLADNPLGFPKLLTPAGTFCVQTLDLLAAPRGGTEKHPPGTVTDVSPEGITVATATIEIRLASLFDLSGRPVGAMDPGLVPGAILPAAAPHEESLAGWERTHRRQERFWGEVLADLLPLAPAGFELDGPAEAEVEITMAPEMLAAILNVPEFDRIDREVALLAAVCAGLAGEIGQPFDVAISSPAERRSIEEAGGVGLLALRQPLRIERIPAAGDFPSFASVLAEQRRSRSRRGTYAIDLPLRLRRVRRRAERGERIEPAVAVDLLAEGEDLGVLPLGEASLAIAIEPLAGRMLWRARAPVGELNALAERFQKGLAGVLVSAGRETEPTEESLISRFRRQADQAPEALALAMGAESWTYGELAQRIERLAAALVRRGVVAERLVALRLGRLVDQVSAMFAVLAAGGAFVVLENADPQGRIERVLSEASPYLILTDTDEAWLARHASVHPIGLADAAEGPAIRMGAVKQAAEASDGTLAYVAFTSGSSGAPKGVAVERKTIAHYIGTAGRFFALGPGDRILQLGSVAFDLAYEQIFGALCHGASLIGLGESGGGLPGTPELFDALDRSEVTVLDLPTAVWEQMTRDAARVGLAWPRALRLVVLGGERASAPAARAWAATASPSIRLVNTYGPTEATIVATWWEAAGSDLALVSEAGLPIGRPIPGVHAWVLDEHREPVPEGQPGELWLGGLGLARGYHRRPEQTAERFVSVAASGTRLYRTGDQVRRRKDGELEFLGRLDRQLKIAGRRIDPSEIEATLGEIPGVVAAAVAPLESFDDCPVRLAAWIVLEPWGWIGAVEQEAAQRLPAFVRFAGFYPVSALPLNRAGKVDFATLRALPGTVGVQPPDPLPEAPLEGTERELAEVWHRVLRCGSVRRQDDFFALGGDSLAAARLLSAIEERFGRRLRIARLLEAPTLAALALEIGAESTSRRDRSAASRCRVDLQPQGTAPALAFVHGLGGHLLRLVPLARLLAPDRPVLGLESPGLDDDRPIPRTIEELAAIFLAALREARGSGPYYLVGMSFGGVVALEMARQAVAAGESVALLALLDTDFSEILPAFRPAPPGRSVRFKSALRRFLGDRLGWSRRRLRRLVRGDEIEKPNEYRHFTAVLHANEEALARYPLGRYAGRVTFFEATPRPDALYDELVRICGCDLERVAVPGDHLSMLEPPHVEGLAAELRRRVLLATGD